jgi:hypothetical protein
MRLACWLARAQRAYMCLTIQSLFSHKLKRRIMGVMDSPDDGRRHIIPSYFSLREQSSTCYRRENFSLMMRSDKIRITHPSKRTYYVDAVFSALFLVAYDRATSLSNPSSILYTTNSSSFCHPLTNLVSPLIFSSSAHPIGIF